MAAACAVHCTALPGVGHTRRDRQPVPAFLLLVLGCRELTGEGQELPGLCPPLPGHRFLRAARTPALCPQLETPSPVSLLWDQELTPRALSARSHRAGRRPPGSGSSSPWGLVPAPAVGPRPDGVCWAVRCPDPAPPQTQRLKERVAPVLSVLTECARLHRPARKFLKAQVRGGRSGAQAAPLRGPG